MITSPFQTGVLATVGPTLETEQHFLRALEAGASNFRFHLGHRGRNHLEDLRTLRKASRSMGQACSALFDLPSGRLRTGPMPARSLVVGERVLVRDCAASTEEIPLPGLARILGHIGPGQEVAFVDRKVRLKVLTLGADHFAAEVIGVSSAGVQLKPNVGVSLPGAAVAWELVTEADLVFLESCHAAGELPDWLALSFVNTGEQLQVARRRLGALAGGPVQLMAKVETSAGLSNIEELAREADGLMVARGDLLTEVAPEELPLAQERIVRAARLRGRVAVVATQMLEQFVDSGEPTRPELTDIACAVRQGATAVMLSRESCASPRAIEAIALMRRVIAAESAPSLTRALVRPRRQGCRIVAIEGPNGVGKSTLGAALAERLGWTLRLGVPEAFMAPALKRRMIFEADWRASALFFLSASMELQRELTVAKGVVLIDRSPWSTLAVHAATDPARRPWVQRLMEACADQLPLPDELLVLKASFETCRSRIDGKAAADRAFDQDSRDYFELEARFYEELAAHHPRARALDTQGLEAGGVLEAAVRELAQLGALR